MSVVAVVAAVLLAQSASRPDPEARPERSRSLFDQPNRPAPRTAARPGFSIGVAGGPAFSFGEGPVWVKLGGRLAYELPPFAQGFQVAITLPLTASAARSEQSILQIQSTGFELLPGARIMVEPVPRLRLYADAGIGAAIYSFDVRLNGGGNGNTVDGTSAGFAFRFGLGAEYALLDVLTVQLEPLQLLLQGTDSVVYSVGGETLHGDPMPPHYGINLGIGYRF